MPHSYRTIIGLATAAAALLSAACVVAEPTADGPTEEPPVSSRDDRWVPETGPARPDGGLESGIDAATATAEIDASSAEADATPVDPPPVDPPVDPPADPPPVEPPPVPAFGCGASPTAVGFLGSQGIDVAGTHRTYELYVPADYDSTRAYPIVFAFHGDGGTGAGLRSSFHLEAASSGQAFIVYPDGTGKTWHNDTLPTLTPDIAFIDAIVDSLVASHCVDSARVFATGMSRGAYFANQLVCRSRTTFRAVASHSGGGPFGVANSEWDGQGHLKCNATLSALQVQGLADSVVPPSEGYKPRDFWRAKNNCAATTSAYGTSPCVGYDSCDRPEVWCAIPGLGHQLWSNAATVTWSFFVSAP